MRKSMYELYELCGKTLKKPIVVTIEQTPDLRWKASTGDAYEISDDRNECLQALILQLEKSKKKQYKD